MLIEQVFADDAPVKVVAGDLLGRKTFIESLASALLRPPGSQCRVVSLEGAWGEGKTSAIEMALDVIGQRDADLRPFVVRLNPWQFGTKDALERALLTELSKLARLEGRRKDGAKFAVLADELLKYSQALSVLKADPSVLALLITAKLAFRLAAKRAKKDLDIQSVKARVSAAIRDAKRPIVVIVDDLDRLLPLEVLEVIRFVRAVGDFDRTTYLLAFDHSRVVEALDKAGVPSPARYLEKIVQLRTHLPPASPEAIGKILNAHLEKSAVFGARHEFEESESRRLELASFYFAPLIQDVRTLLRVLARTEMTPFEVVREVEFWEVFALNVVSVVAPDVFEIVRANPTTFTKAASPLPAGGSDPSSEISEQITRLLSNYPPRVARYVDGLVKSLFPILTKRTTKSQGWMDHNGRVSAERPLLTYLLSGVAEGTLPLDTVRAIVTDQTFRAERITAASQQEGAFHSLVSNIRDEIVVSQLKVESPLDLALQLVHASARLPHPERGLGFSFQDRATRLRPLLVELLVREQNPPRATIRLCDSDAESLITANLIEELVSPGNESSSQLRATFSEHELSRLILQFAQRVTDLFSEDPVSPAQVGSLLFALRRISRADYERVVKQLMENHRNRNQLINALANSVYSSSHGPIATWKDDLLPDGMSDVLRGNARQVIAEGTDDKYLYAAARAILEGAEIVVSTGEIRDQARALPKVERQSE